MSNHPNPDKRYVMVAYRRYILGVKRKFTADKKLQKVANRRAARSLIYYRALVDEYLACKRIVIGASK